MSHVRPKKDTTAMPLTPVDQAVSATPLTPEDQTVLDEPARKKPKPPDSKAPFPWKKQASFAPDPPWHSIVQHTVYGEPRPSKKPLMEAREKRQERSRAEWLEEKERSYQDAPICKHWLKNKCSKGDGRYVH